MKHSRIILTTLFTLVLLAGMVITANADEITIRYVAPDGSDDSDCTNPAFPCGTIQFAIDQADTGDEVRVAAGHFTGVNDLGGLAQVVYVAKTVTIRGGYPPFTGNPNPAIQVTILDAQGQGRGLYVTGHVTPTIEGLYVTGGNATGLGGGPLGYDAGGGIYIITATATISDCRVFSNTASSAYGYGGGVYLKDSPSTLVNSTISNNTASSASSGSGGGVYLDDSPATLTGNTVANNTPSVSRGGYGGGLYLNDSDATLTGNVVSDNTIHSANFTYSGIGGGLYLRESDGALLTGNVIASNTVTSVSNGAAGGLYLFQSNATLTSNTVSGNMVSGSSSLGGGGGLYAFRGTPLLTSNTIVSNTYSSSSLARGGGLYLYDSDAALVDNDVLDNVVVSSAYSPGGQGGGLYVSEGTVTLRDNTFARNTASSDFDAGFGGGMYLSSDAAIAARNTVVSNTAGSGGGGMYLSFGPITVTGNLVISNTAGSGGGMYLSGSDALLINDVIADNRAIIAGGGLYVAGSSPRLLHTTIARNGSATLTAGDVSGLHVANSYSFYSTVSLTNTIVAGHAVGVIVTEGSTVTLASTLWHGNDANWGGAGFLWHDGDHAGDPAFANDGYHLTSLSAAIDAGQDAGIPDDLDGSPRPVGDGHDLGADEYNPDFSWKQEVLVDGVPITGTDTIACGELCRTVAGDVVKIVSRVWVTYTHDVTFTLSGTWTGALELTGWEADTGKITAADSLTWEVDNVAPNAWHAITYTFAVLPGDWDTAHVTETLRVEDAVRHPDARLLSFTHGCESLTGVALTWSPSEPRTGTRVAFSAIYTPSYAALDVVEWVFGNSITATGSPVYHTFTTTGRHTVTVATDACGGSFFDIRAVTIADSGAAFVYLPLVTRNFSLDHTVTDAPNTCSGHAVEVGHRYYDDWDEENDEDWYAFQAVAGVTYTLQTSQLGTRADTSLALYNVECGTLLAENDDISWPDDPASRIVWTAPDDGTYHALVRPYDWRVHGANTDYTFGVSIGAHVASFDVGAGWTGADKLALPSLP